MSDTYEINESNQVVPYTSGRKCTDTRAWRDATDLELQQQEQIEQLERELAEAREQRDTLAEALREIKESEPANHNGDLFYPRYSQDGDWIGDEPVDPLSLLAFIYPRASEAIATLKGGNP